METLISCYIAGAVVFALFEILNILQSVYIYGVPVSLSLFGTLFRWLFFPVAMCRSFLAFALLIVGKDNPEVRELVEARRAAFLSKSRNSLSGLGTMGNDQERGAS